MEVLDKDNKIRNAIPATGILWIVFLSVLYFFIVNVVSPFHRFLAEANSKSIDSWSVVNLIVIVFLVITGSLCLYSVYKSFQATRERKKWEKKSETMEKDNAKLQEMLEGTKEMIESIEEERNKGREKVKELVGEAQSMVDELKRKKRNES